MVVYSVSPFAVQKRFPNTNPPSPYPMLYRDKRWFPPSKFNVVCERGGGYILVGKGDFKARYAKNIGVSQHF